MAHTTKVCGWCGELYPAQRSTSRFCSSSCRSHSYRHNQDPDKEIEQAKTSIFEFYKQQISQLSDSEILGAVAALVLETPEDSKNKKQSMLYNLLNKESQYA